LLSFSTWFFSALYFFKEEPSSFQKRISFFVFCIVTLFFSHQFFFYDQLSLAALFYSCLMITGLYDFMERSIPRFCSLGLLPLVFVVKGIPAIASALFTFLIFQLIIWLFFKWSGCVGMGDGDPEFAALIAAFAGVELIGQIIFCACIIGAILSYLLKTDEIPFGTALAISTFFIITIS
jgi:prepilin signal peptidase PulO-like enzyme (type II secretory pathway)